MSYTANICCEREGASSGGMISRQERLERFKPFPACLEDVVGQMAQLGKHYANPYIRVLPLHVPNASD